MYVVAGSWWIAAVFIDLITAMSSTTPATFGISSLTHVPHSPCCANVKAGAAQGKDLWPAAPPVMRRAARAPGGAEGRAGAARGSGFGPEVVPVMRWPGRTLSGGSVPFRAASFGL